MLVLSSSASSFLFSSLAALSSFRRPLLARGLQRAMVCCCLLLSAALFAVAYFPAIVSPATGRRRILSLLCHWRPVPSLLFGRGRPRPRCCRRGQRRGPVGGHEAVAENQLPAGPPALAAIIVVSAARLGGGRMKPCAAPPCRPSSDAGSTTPRRRRRAVTSSVLLPLTVSIVVGIVGIIASSRRHFVVAVVTGPHNIH